MPCAICTIAKPRRHCPGVSGEICTTCCATGREETVDCPLDCIHLREAHRHERLAPVDPANTPNGDVRVTDPFLRENETFLVLLTSAMVEAMPGIPAVTDWDIRDAIAALISVYRAAESGLVVEARPVNPYATAVFDAVIARVADIRQRIKDAGADDSLPDATITGLLVFLQRLEYHNNNRRKRSRAFMDMLTRFFANARVPDEEEPAVLVQP